MKFKFILFALLLNCYATIALAQAYWEHYDINSGLPQTQLSGAIIEDEANIWLLSDFELTKFNSITKQFGPIWNTSNSNLVGQNYTNLIQANNRIWFSHDNGLTAIDSGSIINYSTASGLLSNDIRDLTTDTNGNLWIASPHGVSHFDGTQFIHDTTVAAYHIAIDDSNRVFIINRRFNIIFNNNGPYLTHQVFDGSTWSSPAVTGLGSFPVGLLNIKFHQTTDGIFVSSKDYNGGVYKLSYPFHLDSVPLFYPEHSLSTTRTFRINNLHVDGNGRKWVISDQELILFSTNDSVLKAHHMNPIVEKYQNAVYGNEIITSNGRMTLFACNNGVSLGYYINEPSKVTKELNSNLIRTNISSLGPLFHNLSNDNAFFEFPKGSGKHGIYQAQFIHAHKKSSQNYFETNLLDIYERTHEIGPISNKALVDREWVIRMTKAEIDQHIANVNNRGYVSPENIANWPSSGNGAYGMGLDLAPFVDVDNDSCYNPDIGDYPFIKGDEALYWINHIDQFEYHGMLYAYNDSNNTNLQETVFLDYTIFNRDSAKYDSIRFGMYVDFDLGNANDDYLGSDTAANGFYVYNADAFDEGANGYGSSPPALGVKFLNELLDGFVSYSNGNNYNGTPNNSQDMHNYLQGKWKDGVPITTGGNGRNTTGSTTKIMFPGSPSISSGWTELGPPNQLFSDRRGIASIPYFGLNIGEKKTISLAISFGVNSSSSNVGSSIPQVRNNWNVAQLKFDSAQTLVPNYVSKPCSLLTNIGTPKLTEENNEEGFKLYPNPSSGVLYIETEQIPVNSYIRIFSSNGSLVSELLTNGKKMEFNLTHLPQGFYFIRCGSQTKKLILQQE